eukprot:scaffold49977_cov23-Tisochrysis_lutea.AAC.1
MQLEPAQRAHRRAAGAGRSAGAAANVGGRKVRRRPRLLVAPHSLELGRERGHLLAQLFGGGSKRSRLRGRHVVGKVLNGRLEPAEGGGVGRTQRQLLAEHLERRLALGGDEHAAAARECQADQRAPRSRAPRASRRPPPAESWTAAQSRGRAAHRLCRVASPPGRPARRGDRRAARRARGGAQRAQASARA